MSNKHNNLWLFKAIKFLVRVFYPKIELIGVENLPDEPCLIIGNHSQLHGPVSCELYLPNDCYTWCAGQMMKLREVPSYAYKDFWSQKPKFIKPFFKLISYMIAPLCVVIFNNARTIAVYHDNRILTTFKESVSKLENGKKIVVFPEKNQKHNNIIYEFQEGFVDIARLYYNRTGKQLSFVPLYIAPKLKKMYLGKPVEYCADSLAEDERHRICNCIMNEITSIARSLPEHTVVPYQNISKKFYPANK